MDNNRSKLQILVSKVYNHVKNRTIRSIYKPTSLVKMSSEIKSIPLPSDDSFIYRKLSMDDSRMTNNDIETDILNNKANMIDCLNKNSDTKDSRLTLTSMTYDNSFIQNDLSKKTSTYSLFLEESTKTRHPIMGKTALLKKSNLDHSDSFIIHSLILNKYEDILNHYVSRMYKRRTSRLSSEDDNSEYSGIRNDSPSTLSSIEYMSDARYYEHEKKFYSVEDLNKETCRELSDSYFDNRDSTCCSEYDPKKFLADALGDLSVFEIQNCTVSNNTQICEESVGTSHVSSLLSKANSFCSSLRRNLSRKHSRKSSTGNFSKNSEGNILEQYKRELSRQNSIIFQVSKALSYCKTSKNFFIGRERLEAEKILLVATITKEALINEISAIEFDTYRCIFDPRCTGCIKISSITFNVKENNDQNPKCHHDEYFLVVFMSGKNVLSSEITKGSAGILKIDKTFKFHSLQTDFEIVLNVYSLVISNKDFSTQDSYKCPSPKSIFKCNKEFKHCKISNKHKSTEQITFMPTAKCHIRNSELSKIKNGSLSLTLTPETIESSLESMIDLKIDSEFKLANRLTGFLTIGLDNGKNCLTWNRRWCLLDGFILKYWNYPSEETSEPLSQVDMRYSAVHRAVLADRSLCARPKTLFVPIKTSDDVKKYFLSADTQTDLQIWEAELNFVIQSLLIWKGMEDF